MNLTRFDCSHFYFWVSLLVVIPLVGCSGGERPDEATSRADGEAGEVRGLGYVAPGQSSSGKSGVYRFDKSKAWNGFNLYISSHSTRAFLTDMEGTTLHEWHCSWEKAFPGKSPQQAIVHARHKSPDKKQELAQFNSEGWSRVKLLSNGDLLAVYPKLGLIRLDKNSNLVWAQNIPVHHDLWISEDENKLFTLAKKPRTAVFPEQNLPYLDELITVVDLETGRVMREVSIGEALRNSDYYHLLKRLNFPGDVFHANAVRPVTGDRLPEFFNEGDVLVSLRELNALVLVDLSGPRVKWAMIDLFYRQHDPDFLENGNILVYDNGKNFSRVIQVDPVTQQVVWEYTESPKEEFFSSVSGLNQRLPNGNTLISESTRGRVFEVTKEGEIVWEFYNPHSDELHPDHYPFIQMERYGRDAVNDWLEVPPNHS